MQVGLAGAKCQSSNCVCDLPIYDTFKSKSNFLFSQNSNLQFLKVVMMVIIYDVQSTISAQIFLGLVQRAYNYTTVVSEG